MTWEGQWLSWGFPEGPGHAQGGGSGSRQTRVRGGPCVLEGEWGATPPRGGDGSHASLGWGFGEPRPLGMDWGPRLPGVGIWGATPLGARIGGATPPRRPRTRDAVSGGRAGPSTSISPNGESSRSCSAGSTEHREPLHLLTPRPGFFLLSAAAENGGPERACTMFSSLEISVTNGALLQCGIPHPSKFDPVVNFGA